TFVNETAGGWQQMLFATPVAITANTMYVASYHTATGGASWYGGYFRDHDGWRNGSLYAPGDAAAGGNGVYAYGPPGTFPNRSYAGGNFWVDLLFTTTR
ncbi:MAG TPA: DUF4082 domain-containing protein, partial [Bryobacteraceae bacterium]|nr:DUF4082 domain-containing protein [Bryobacteraceae bacterium]